jgi:hypothetical protein
MTRILCWKDERSDPGAPGGGLFGTAWSRSYFTVFQARMTPRIKVASFLLV